MRRTKSLLLTGLASALLAVGCNAVLDNQSGSLADGGTSPPSEGVDATAPPPGDNGGDDGGTPTPTPTPTPTDVDASTPIPPAPTPVTDGGPPVSTTCSSGRKLCGGMCVSIADPLFGCGDTTCDPCNLKRARAACSGGACVVAACNTGYADCDLNAANGCETDLAHPNHCGACNATCGAAAPDCAPTSSGGFACSTGCGASAPTLCGDECVDLTTSIDHCGDCNVACGSVDHATTTCSGGHCGFTCQGGFHACGGACASNDSPATCGGSCSPCSAPAHATATCDGNACGFDCAPGFANCDANAANGCETNLTTDALNCGACGASCNGGTCANAQCSAPPPPPPPPPQDAGSPPPQDSGPPPPPPPADASTD